MLELEYKISKFEIHGFRILSVEQLVNSLQLAHFSSGIINEAQ